MKFVKREQKEVPFRPDAVYDPVGLAAICARHQVDIRRGEGYVSVVLTERSTDLEGFARSVLNADVVRIPDQRFGEFYRDLSTLECP